MVSLKILVLSHFMVFFGSQGYLINGSLLSLSEMWKVKSPQITHQKIVGGLPADQGQFPYQLSIRIDGFHFCGGSLIQVAGELFVLTAAHCVEDLHDFLERLSIVAGDVNISDTTGNEQIRQVQKIIIHEEYGTANNLSGLYNDIALIFLDTPFELNKYVEVVNLPEENDKLFGNLTVSGWGTLYSGGDTPNTLQYIVMPIVNQSVCQEKWKHHPEYPLEIGDGILCSGVESGTTSACHGDSGGPAVSQAKGHLVGIVSFGDPSCSHPDYPGGFTNVAHYKKWIQEKIQYYTIF